MRLGKKLLYSLVYNLSKDELRILRDYLDKILVLGFIRRLILEVVALLMFMYKKGKDPRLYGDYRGLNIIIVLNRYPILLISEILNRLGNIKIFTKLDLKGVYNLIRIKESYKHLIVFRIRFRLFEYLVILFGLYNVPATF